MEDTKVGLGVSLSGRALRSNLLFVPHKRISTAIPNAKLANRYSFVRKSRTTDDEAVKEINDFYNKYLL